LNAARYGVQHLTNSVQPREVPLLPRKTRLSLALIKMDTADDDDDDDEAGRTNAMTSNDPDTAAHTYASVIIMGDSPTEGAAVGPTTLLSATVSTVKGVRDVILRWQKQRMPLHPPKCNDFNPDTFNKLAALHNKAFRIAKTFGVHEAHCFAGPVAPQPATSHHPERCYCPL
jgi:hypothetical protein